MMNLTPIDRLPSAQSSIEEKPFLHRQTRFLFAFFCSLLFSLTMPINNAQAEELIPLRVKSVEGKIAIYDTIKVSVHNLDEWSKQAINNSDGFELVIDGIPFSGLNPTLIRDNTHLQFTLKRTPDSREAWKTLLSRKPTKAQKEVSVTIQQNNVIVYGEAKADMEVINLFWFKTFAGVSLLTLFLFFLLAKKSDVIRVSGKQPRNNLRKPFSLARTQMAFWFFTIIISYVFIWMVTRDLSILTPSVLGLMGLSAATGLGSAIMDSSKRQEKDRKRTSVEIQLQADELDIAELGTEVDQMYQSRGALPDIALLNRTDADPLTVKEAALAAKQKEIEQSKRMIRKYDIASEPRSSVSFFADILSDDNGYSFHRVQMFAWTVVLIVIFITSVSSLLAMPDFDTTLLGLVGISGATYLGFKFPNQEG